MRRKSIEAEDVFGGNFECIFLLTTVLYCTAMISWQARIVQRTKNVSDQITLIMQREVKISFGFQCQMREQNKYVVHKEAEKLGK